MSVLPCSTTTRTTLGTSFRVGGGAIRHASNRNFWGGIACVQCFCTYSHAWAASPAPRRSMGFAEYFDRRAHRFGAWYTSEAITRILGRGAILDRLDFAVRMARE